MYTSVELHVHMNEIKKTKTVYCQFEPFNKRVIYSRLFFFFVRLKGVIMKK